MNHFRWIPLLVFMSVCVTISAQDKPPGEWQTLFNGTDLTGWKPFLSPGTTATVEHVWSVKDGVLICRGKPAGYIMTDKAYGNYELRVQWRWPEGLAKGRNSGVLLHVNGEDKIWPKCAEAQLASGGAGDFWLIDGFKLDIDPARQDPKTARHYFRLKHDSVEQPIGEWNQYEITCTSDTIRLKINGLLVNEGENPELARGRICLQSEGAEIHFRDIGLRSLD